MKKYNLLWIVALFFLIATSISQAAIFRYAANGKKDGAGEGKAGYNVVITHYWNLFIFCNDPGSEPCPPGIIGPPEPTPQHQVDAVNYALNKIAQGILNGAELQGSTNIEWTSTNTDATTCDIIVWDTNETKPIKPPGY